MIKNLLNADEEPPEGTKVIIEDTIITPANNPETAEANTFEEIETRPVFEIPEDAKFFARPAEESDEGKLEAELERLSAEIPEDAPERTLFVQDALPVESAEMQNTPVKEQIFEESIDGKSYAEKSNYETSGTLFQSEVQPLNTVEAVRQSGLAYSAAIVLLASVVFTMILGWFADLLLGSSPFGIVGGIVLGAIIGFIQFFRITSQIFKK